MRLVVTLLGPHSLLRMAVFSFQGTLQIVYSLRVVEKDLWGTISLVTTWTMLGLKLSKVFIFALFLAGYSSYSKR